MTIYHSQRQYDNATNPRLERLDIVEDVSDLTDWQLLAAYCKFDAVDQTEVEIKIDQYLEKGYSLIEASRAAIGDIAVNYIEGSMQ